MRTIKLSKDEELALREVIRLAGKHLDMGEGQKHLESVLNQIQNAPDDTVMFMELVDAKTGIPYTSPNLREPEEDEEDEEEEELDLDSCPECGEDAWDGYICHICGAKNI